MTIYVPRYVEVEAMQWDGTERGPLREYGLRENAVQIVAWVNANGGEARYEPLSHVITDPHPARIMVHTNSGWAPVAPGWWVIRGSETFKVADPHRDYSEEPTFTLLDHYPCDPVTFDQRWVVSDDTGDRHGD